MYRSKHEAQAMARERLKVNVSPEALEMLNSIVQQAGPTRVELISRQLTAAFEATLSDYEQLGDIILLEREKKSEPEQVKTKIRQTPFAGLVGLLPKDRIELYAFLAVLLAVIQIVITLLGSTQTISPAQVQEIIERVVDHIEHPPPTLKPPAPPADHK
jgi:hypothetical protein